MSWVQWWCTGVMLDRLFLWPRPWHDGPYAATASQDQETTVNATAQSISLETGKTIDYTA